MNSTKIFNVVSRGILYFMKLNADKTNIQLELPDITLQRYVSKTNTILP